MLYYLIENILILKILLIILVFKDYIQIFKYSILKIFEFLNLLVI